MYLWSVQSMAQMHRLKEANKDSVMLHSPKCKMQQRTIRCLQAKDHFDLYNFGMTGMGTENSPYILNDAIKGEKLRQKF